MVLQLVDQEPRLDCQLQVVKGVAVEGQVEAEDGRVLDGEGEGALKGQINRVEIEVRREAGVERLRH